MSSHRLPLFGIGLATAGLLVIAVGGAFDAGPGGATIGRQNTSGFGGMMNGSAGMMGGAGGMMSGAGGSVTSVDPSSPGFIPGTAAAPRVVRVVAGGQLRFLPDVVTIKQGETITFEVTSMGMSTHEFMVGPAADVAADVPGTSEVADIGMMQTKSLRYTFVGSGPFAFACHATGHYEAGMKGTIVVFP